MYKKNYLSRGEQELWEHLHDKDIIDTELVQTVFPEISANKRNKLLHNLYVKGYLQRARKNLYYNPQNLKDIYSLAFRIREGYLGLASALKYYGLIDYEDFTIFIITKSFQKRIPIKGTKYEIKFIPMPAHFHGFMKKEEYYISTVEKTIFDCLLKPREVGLQNITKAIYEAKIDWKEFLNLFKLSKNSSLYQRTGYILELIKKETKLDIPNYVFEFLLKKVNAPVKLAVLPGTSIFNKKWMIQDNVGQKNILSWWY